MRDVELNYTNSVVTARFPVSIKYYLAIGDAKVGTYNIAEVPVCISF